MARTHRCGRPSRPRTHTDEDGGIMVFRTPYSPNLDMGGDIVCDWRPGEVW